jgi:hypothetical protein
MTGYGFAWAASEQTLETLKTLKKSAEMLRTAA